jgi:NADH-quinone oxidoreductase subunit L
MFDIARLLILIPALPLAACVMTAVFGRRVLGTRSHIPVITALGISAVASIALVLAVQQEVRQVPADSKALGVERVVKLWNWAAFDASQDPASPIKPFSIDITLRADPLTAVMLAMVTCISLLVAVYSSGYMQGDPGYARFYTYIALFVFSMTMLVSVSNFLLVYVFWEGVGLCSYLLIGFWFHKPEAAAAGKKAFLVNRVGDFGFALAIFLLWTTYGTLDFHDSTVGGRHLLGILGQTRLMNPHLFVAGGTATAICLLLLAGACGKSAQFPLHVWLPDAMEGPTPVSALIHAATMVTAGVYLVARCSPLFAVSLDAQQVLAIIGSVTAVLGALIAVSQTDLKRILAYSTISQLGYMFLGLGTGTLVGVTAGMFHLVTHAVFKALLFLGAGSVMHAMGGVIDLRRIGGLWRRMPTTHWTFLFGALALAGMIPFAGFWSKDAILAAVREQANGPAGRLYYGLYIAAIVTALVTAFYTFRAYFLTFFGPERIPEEAGHHAHESPRSMTLPLVLLALGSLVVGAYFQFTGNLFEFLGRTPSLAYLARHAGHADHAAAAEIHQWVMITSIAVASAGVLLAALVYVGSPTKAARVARLADWTGLGWLSRGKFFFDEIYQLLIVSLVWTIARVAAWFDRNVIDALVDLIGALPRWAAAELRPLQNGVIPFYALGMILGLLLLAGMMLM